MQNNSVTIGHSPDADDAFMFYGFAAGIVKIPNKTIEHVINDIQTLNEMSLTGDLDITAISAAHYPTIADKYRIMSCGVSMGNKYGPVVIAKSGMSEGDLADKVIGCPGRETTSWVLYRVLVGHYREVKFFHFDELDGALERDEIDAAIMLHEKQVTYRDEGLQLVVDLGKKWFEETNLPIPLGLDVIKRSLADDEITDLARAFYLSIKCALDNEDDALDFAMSYGRGLSREKARKFIKMYVNQDTLDMGDSGKQALKTLYAKGIENDIWNSMPPLDIVQAS